MLDALTASQYSDWLCWMRRYHPFPNRNDPYFAMLLSMTANQWITESHSRTRPDDFLLYSRPEDRFDDDMTAEELRMKLGLPA